MDRIKRSWLIAIFAIGVVVILANDMFRKVAAIEDGIAAILLGSAPNFIAALTCPALILLELAKLRTFSHFSNKALGLVSGAVTFVLLLIYELSQAITPNAVLDSNDILATIFGAAVWLVAWPSVRKFLSVASS